MWPNLTLVQMVIAWISVQWFFQNHSGPLLMRSISRRKVAEMNSGSDGHYMSKSPVIFSKSFLTLVMQSISRPHAVKVNSGPDSHHLNPSPVILFPKSFWTLIYVEYFTTSSGRDETWSKWSSHGSVSGSFNCSQWELKLITKRILRPGKVS